MSKSAAKNETLIFIRSLPFSVSAYDIGNNRATPFSGNEIYNYRGSESIEGLCVSDLQFRPLRTRRDISKAEIEGR